jgi:hypothetical protein
MNSLKSVGIVSPERDWEGWWMATPKEEVLFETGQRRIQGDALCALRPAKGAKTMPTLNVAHPMFPKPLLSSCFDVGIVLQSA